MAKLTDTQLLLLSKASQRADRGVELPANLKGGAAQKIVDRLIRNGLLEEIQARSTLPVWRRDDNTGPMALRLTRHGLDAIAVGPEEVTAAADPNGRKKSDLTDGEVSSSGSTGTQRKRNSGNGRKTGREYRQRKQRCHGKARTKTGSRRETRPCSKQARVIDMLRASAGTSITMIMKATGWQQHSVRGFFAGVVRKKLGLNLNSEKVDGERIYRIVDADGANSASRRSSRGSARRLEMSKG